MLRGTIRVPDAVGPVLIEADLQARMVTIAADVKAPDLKRPSTRVSWMLRQLKEAPDDLRVEATFPHVRQPVASLLREARDEPDLLLLAGDPKRGAKVFTLALGRRMGAKRGKKPGSFVAETEAILFDFYGQVVQGIKKWTPPAPRLRKEPEPVGDEALRPVATAAPESTPPTAVEAAPESRETASE